MFFFSLLLSRVQV